MTITVGIFLILFGVAFVCEFIDSSTGMGYGTILSPILIIYGFEPSIAVPAVLFSQALGGFSATIFHFRFKNLSFQPKSNSLRSSILIAIIGVIATVFAAFISISIPKYLLKSYIGLLVLVMGIILLTKLTFKASMKKITFIAILSAFNKGLSGGGFGPVTTSGQIISGQDEKTAIGVTTFSEVPICLAGTLTYIIGKITLETPSVLSIPVRDFFDILLSGRIVNLELILALSLGAVLSTPFGALTTRLIKPKSLRRTLGIIVTILGIWTLYKTWF
ncbi:MAG: hypothetical protein C0601_09265 [Candidatus Muiribacterium halophilum]|uniref:Probable membrane transporter protein n=1 Tax=Muiribacterium halophilum TaxID=2053465 RepID=A0A2N5ZDS5_MUIH1|nr:MAG: hypothetical protein C0601_09265 [Candidatus Muirbacterium halophilum]